MRDDVTGQEKASPFLYLLRRDILGWMNEEQHIRLQNDYMASFLLLSAAIPTIRPSLD